MSSDKHSIGNFGLETSKSTRRFFVPVLAFVLLAALLFGAFVVVGHYCAQRRTVHVVNGTNSAYEVEIAGQNVVLPAKGMKTLIVAEGQITMRVLTPTAEEPITMTLESPFYLRALGKPIFVINPDRAAILLLSHVGYSSRPEKIDYSKAPEDVVYTGANLYQWERIDFPFSEPPDEVRMDSHKSVEFKTNLINETDVEVADGYDWIVEEHGAEAAQNYLWARIRFEPGNNDVLRLLWKHSDRQQLREFLRPHLLTRPLLIDVHRCYQAAVETLQPDYDLESEYRGLLASNPGDPAAAYLLGRALDDPQEADILIRRAALADPPVEQALHALILRTVAAGRFREAIPLAEKLRAVHEEDVHSVWHEAEAMLGAGQLEAALMKLQRAAELDPGNGYALPEVIAVLYQLDRAEEARALVDAFLAETRTMSPEAAAYWEPVLAGALDYAAGDTASMIARLREHPGPYARFVAAVAAGEIQSAAALVDELDDDDETTYHMIAAVAAMHHGASSTAEVLVKSIHARLTELGRDGRLRAAWLSGEAPVDVPRLRAMPMHVNDKLPYVLLLAQRFPAHRALCLAEARPLNFSRTFPYRLYVQILDTKR